MTDKIAPTSRRAYAHEGRVIYFWDQTFDEVNVYIPLPSGARARDLAVTLTSKSFTVGIKNTPPYLSHDFTHAIKGDDSFWTVEDGELHATLTKVTRGKAWAAPFDVHCASSDALQSAEDEKRLMLERFQGENPGFDFSDATFNGAVPDASTYMGGARTT